MALKDQYFDLQGLSAYSSLSVSTLRDHIKVDALPCYQLKGKILVRRSEFDEWMKHFIRAKTTDINKIADDIIGVINRRS